MNQFSDNIKGYEGQNPFSDSQARNFSDNKVINEFYPISMFWNLFNDQHEILLGTRGSGKTFLLKMMRYSMLKKLDDENAKEMIKSKEYLALYVPMHLEYVMLFNDSQLGEQKQIELFQTAFNSLLAVSLLSELEAILEDITDTLDRIKKTMRIAKTLDEIWFDISESSMENLTDLANKVRRIPYEMYRENKGIMEIPPVFRNTICSSLNAVKTNISQIMEFENEPTWIICIDEAEFLNHTLQKCINSVFRADSNRIALKVATLPFFHETKETLVNGISVSDENDFSYRVVDLAYDSIDFINLTNKLCAHRLKTRFDKKNECNTLEHFLGKVENDDLIDYFRLEKGHDKAEREQIEKEIINSFSEKRKTSAPKYTNKRKTIYDKYAPIYFVREMYKLSQQGNRKPGWYAGATNVRKLAQGNPRVFIQIMHELFEKARESSLTPKAQHNVILKFARMFCKSTQALESQGPIIYNNMKYIAEILHNRTHDGNLITVSAAFNIADLEITDSKNLEWLKVAIAYSRIIVNDEVKKHGIVEQSKFILANAYAMAYWIPMRSDTPFKIKFSEKGQNTYTVKKMEKKEMDNHSQQLSMF